MELRQLLRQNFEANRNWVPIHTELKRLRADGVDREMLTAELTAIYSEAASEEEYQDFVADIMDFFYGWCAPELRID